MIPMICRHERLPHTFVLRTEQWIDAPREQVFEFFADAFQLEAITPPWLHFHVLTPRPIPMAPGALIDYRLRLRGIPIRWRTEIDVWEPPVRFVDRQLKGPYALWEHEHTFEDHGERTLMRDEVAYRLPFARVLGPIAQWLMVRRDLEQIFRYRAEVIARYFAPDNSVGQGTERAAIANVTHAPGSVE